MFHKKIGRLTAQKSSHKEFIAAGDMKKLRLISRAVWTILFGLITLCFKNIHGLACGTALEEESAKGGEHFQKSRSQ